MTRAPSKHAAVCLLAIASIILIYCASNLLSDFEVIHETRVLIGIFTVLGSVHRRDLLRHFYSQQIIPGYGNVQIVYVIGAPDQDTAALQVEIANHGDMLVLDTPENMNDGKTFSFFQHAGMTDHRQVPPWDYVMKVDDDSYIDLPKLIETIHNMTETRTYLGRICNLEGMPSYEHRWPYMCGMGYALSWDLAQWIADSQQVYSLRNYTPWEDVTTGYWMSQADKPVKLVDVGDKFHHLSADDDQGPYMRLHTDSILVHGLKDEVSLNETAMHVNLVYLS